MLPITAPVSLTLILRLTKYSLSADPATWGSALPLDQAEPDDELHNPDPSRDRGSDKAGPIFTLRGLSNLGCLAILVGTLVTLLYGPSLPLPHFHDTDTWPPVVATP